MFDSLELKIKMKESINKAIIYWSLMLIAAKKESYIHYKQNRFIFLKHLDHYKLI